MRRKSYFPIFPAANAVLAGAFLFLLQSTLPAAAAQEPEPSSPVAAQDPQPPPPAAAQEPATPPPVAAAQESQLPITTHAKVKKVLTNDDLESSRTPMDQYLVDKEAQEGAAQAAADELASQQALAGIKMPATVEETRRAMRDAHQDIDDEKDAIDRLNKEFETAPDVQKAGIQREIDRHTTGVQTSEQELKALREHLRQLNGKSQGENSPNSGKQLFE
jgi:hypothetical protein